MNLLSQKALSATAAVATLSIAALTVANPANALTFSKTNAAPSGSINGSPVLPIIPGSLPSGGVSLSGGVPLLGSLTVGRNSTATFTFSNPISSFGANLLFLGSAATQGNIFFDISGITNGALTTQSVALSAFTGAGNYFNIGAGSPLERFTTVAIRNANTGGGALGGLTRLVTFNEFTYQVPTPALLPGLIGLGAAAWRKRKGQEAEKAGVDA
ncbi:PTPA-CTERM sorting domain-containing protein [Stenomitos frigidus]|uniref:PTPA-CTERM sorting domain-containing protein n=1 Tax=Stenomitos frigidus ULC18 TaxID=2107698 RepID=A0A2T1ESM1_9CYAN|nr:PTPA-CTERM sorting domain-containing protein [Stenomitos frigidus]PSB35729.1 hypothetical protein C7B82_00470 [Stenomitos frigidus ULC18]